MAESEDVARIETAIRDLARDAAQARDDRHACEEAIATARDALARASANLPEAERFAKQCRASRHETVRGRAELEHRLATLIENEGLARSRAERAEALAQGFRSAANFATIAASEAEASCAWARAERERLVAERASRECALAESRALEERAEEHKYAVARAETEIHVNAEREIEATIGADRIDAELQVSALRQKIARASAALAEAEAASLRAEAESERIAEEARLLRTRLHDATTNVRGSIETRIAELRRMEREIVAERIELEDELAQIVEDEMKASSEARAAEADAEATTATRIEPPPIPDEPETPRPAQRPPVRRTNPNVVALASLAAAPIRLVSDASPTTPTERDQTPAQHSVPASARTPIRAVPPKRANEELIPGLLSAFGTIFARRQTSGERRRGPSNAESALVADRIERDFGLLGTRAADTPLREEVGDLEPERLGGEGLQ